MENKKNGRLSFVWDPPSPFFSDFKKKEKVGKQKIPSLFISCQKFFTQKKVFVPKFFFGKIFFQKKKFGIKKSEL